MLAAVGPAALAVRKGYGAQSGRYAPRFRKLQWEKSTKYLDRSSGRRIKAVEVRKFGKNPIGGWKDIASTGLAAIGGAVVSEIVSRMVATRTPEGGKHPFYSKDAVLRILAKPTGMEAAANAGLIAVFLGGAGFAANKGYGMLANVLGGMGFGAIAHYGVRVFVHYILPMILKVVDGNEMTLANQIAAWEQPSNADAIAAEIKRTDSVTSEAQQDPLPMSYKTGDAVTADGYKWLLGRVIGVAPPQPAPDAKPAAGGTTASSLGALSGQARIFQTEDVRGLAGQGETHAGHDHGAAHAPSTETTRDVLAAYINGDEAVSTTGCGGGCGGGSGCGGGCGGAGSGCGEGCGCDACQEEWGTRPVQGGPQGGGTMTPTRPGNGEGNGTMTPTRPGNGEGNGTMTPTRPGNGEGNGFWGGYDGRWSPSELGKHIAACEPCARAVGAGKPMVHAAPAKAGSLRTQPEQAQANDNAAARSTYEAPAAPPSPPSGHRPASLPPRSNPIPKMNNAWQGAVRVARS